MHSALFNTNEPTAATGAVEFYYISLKLQTIEGRKVSFVQETHGWWSNETGKALLDDSFMSQPEEFESFEDAVDRFCQLRVNCAKRGFMHSFSWHPVTRTPTNYKLVELPIGSESDSPEGSFSPA
jgi:hypothetical protein